MYRERKRKKKQNMNRYVEAFLSLPNLNLVLSTSSLFTFPQGREVAALTPCTSVYEYLVNLMLSSS